MTSDPLLCRDLDDLVYNEFGEENPHPLSEYEEHAALEAQMNALGQERIFVPGFSQRAMMWRDIASRKEFALNYWDGVKEFLMEHQDQMKVESAVPKAPNLADILHHCREAANEANSHAADRQQPESEREAGD